jgi:hypothetical protein
MHIDLRNHVDFKQRKAKWRNAASLGSPFSGTILAEKFYLTE